jgi:sulfopyruvate decarboxylase subunit beta
MKRVHAIEVIAEELTDELVVCNLGFPSRELYALHDKDTHFYMFGSMGLASSIGLGISLSQPRKVVVLDGDGSLLMNLGSLATIANHAPENYLLVVIDNRCYGSTGCQPTATSKMTDLSAVASGAGLRDVKTVSTVGGIRSGVHGSGMLVITVDPGNAEVPIIDREPATIKSRFMREIGAL